MRVTTCAIFDIESGRLLSRKWTGWDGPVALCKGASAQEQSIAGQQQQFFKTLQDSYGQMFATQQGFMNAMNSQYGKILAGGPGQFGYTPQEEASMRGQAVAQAAGTSQMAEAALQQRLAAQGGGATAAPSGTVAQMQAILGAGEAQQEATAQNEITQKGYDVGRANFWGAAQGEMGLVNASNPTPYAGAATSAGSSAFGMADTVQKEKSAASFGNIAGGILGNVVGVAGAAFGGPAGAAIGKAAGGWIGGIGSGGGGAGQGNSNMMYDDNGNII